MKRLAFLVSGSGTNLQAVMDACESGDINGSIEVVISSNQYAYALVRAESAHIPNYSLPLSAFKTKEDRDAEILAVLNRYKVDYVVLAGFKAILSKSVVGEYANRIISIHPSLLPKYGGKGFYGHHVHDAVVAAHEKESGITIHYVNEKYDSGNIIFQKKVALAPTDTPDDVAAKIHILEQENFPLVIEKLLFDKK